MAGERDMQERIAFTEKTVGLEKSIGKLCAETYKATKRPPAEDVLRDLIKRAEAQIAEYESLLEKNTGGRRDSILRSKANIGSLKKFTETLRKTIKKG